VEEIVEDVDESQFIPAYLSSTENEELNNTELNTEYNTSRPFNGGGGQTDRISAKGSIKQTSGSGAKAGRGSSTVSKKDRMINLTDRETSTQQWLTSEIQSSL